MVANKSMLLLVYLAMVLHLGQVHLIRVVREDLDVLWCALTVMEPFLQSRFVTASETPHSVTMQRTRQAQMNGAIQKEERREGEGERQMKRERGKEERRESQRVEKKEAERSKEGGIRRERERETEREME